MSARAALLVCWNAVLLCAVISTAALADSPWVLAPGEAYTEVRGGYFSADTYHRADGARVAMLFGGGEVERRSLVWTTELGWKKRLSFLFGVPLESVTRRYGTGATDRTITGFGDAQVGFRYGIAGGATALSLHLDWKAPLAYERGLGLTHQDSLLCGPDYNGDGDSLDANCLRQVGRPRHGEGQQDVALSLHFGTALPWLRGFLQASGGYQYRLEDPQDRLLAGADLGIWISRSLLISGRYLGALLVGEGERPTDDPEEHRVGPQVLWRTEHLDVFAGSLHTAAATNELHRDEIFVGVAVRQSGLAPLRGYRGDAPAP
jgi:hypothetical protein